MSTEEYLCLYLETFVRPFRRPNTAACYVRAWNALPRALLALPLEQLNGLTIQAAINAQARAHPRAAQLTYACLHAALEKAVRLQLLAASPMAACLKPLHTVKRADVLTVEQLALYLDAARASPAWPLQLCMATLGLRRGEALGLTWRAVDLAAGNVHICQQRIGKQLSPLKTAASVRMLPLSAPISAELAAIKAAQHVRSIDGLVCGVSATTLRRAHMATLAAAGLPPITLHGLRHSVAAATVVQGCPIKVLQGILGHSKFELTADLYADHLTSEAYKPYISRLSRALL